MNAELLTLRGVRVRRGETPVVEDLDLSLGPGECVLVVGPNGAGKSSLADALQGVLAHEGRIQLEGSSIEGWSTKRRIVAGLVVCPERLGLLARLSVEENLMVALEAVGRRLDRSDLESVATPHFEWILDRRRQAAGTLSGGERRMLGLVRAALLRPRVLVLDEPTIGLAPAAVKTVSSWLAGLIEDAGLAVLLLDQRVALGLAVATRAAILQRGRLAHDSSLQRSREDRTQAVELLRRYLGLGADAAR